MLNRTLIQVLVLLATIWLAACSAEGQQPNKGSTSSAAESTGARITLEPCHPLEFRRPARCGRFEVYENREAAKGRKISLNIVLLPATGREKAPDPLFMLAGGPGEAATKSFGPMVPALSKLARTRDIVLVDQRGTGDSNSLHCDVENDDLAEMFKEGMEVEVAQKCLAKLDADLKQYTTNIAADDLDDVRAALGYQRINLYGVSYGTRAALVYLRRHSSRVRSIILDGVAPPSMVLPLTFSRDAQRALDRVVEDCEANEHCRSAFPDFRTDVTTLLADLAAKAPEVTVRHPRTGKQTKLKITRGGFARFLRFLLYSAELTALLPYTIKRAREGDFEPFIAQALLFGDKLDEVISFGMQLSVICAEDFPRLTEKVIAQHTPNSFLGDTVIRELQRACSVWPQAPLPAGFGDPVVSDVPALVLSGQFDPVTPPSWGKETASHLSNSKHVVVPGAGHGTLTLGCVPGLVAEFLQTNAAALDTSCLKELKRPRFFIDFAGPALK